MSIKIKQMSQTEFLAKYTGVRNIIKRRVDILNVKVGKFDFTPARKWLEIKLSHTIRVFKLYSVSEKVTYMFLIDDGFVSIVGNRWYRKWDEPGYLVKMEGDVSIDEFLDKNDKLFTMIYNEHEAELEEHIRKDKEKEEQTA